MRLSPLFAAPALIAFLVAPAVARPLSEAEAKGLTSAVEAYQRAISSSDAEKIVATIPPRVVNVFVGAAGIEAKKVQETLVGQTRELMKSVKVTDFVVAPGPYEGADETLADGSKLVWATVPAQFVTDAGGKKALNHQPLFAVLEDGTWYFSRIDGEQAQALVATAYPFVAKVKFPAPTSAPAK